MPRLPKHLLFDWGNTLMVDDPTQSEPMHLWAHVQIVPGVSDVIPKLAAKHTLSVATNALASTADEVRLALARVGIAQYFTHIFSAGELGPTKDNPAFWRMILERLNAVPDEVAMIGDSLESDVLPASRLGIMGIWFLHRPDDTLTMPHFATIRSLRELLASPSL